MNIKTVSSGLAHAGILFLSLTLAACGGSSSSSSDTGGSTTTNCSQPSSSDSQGCTYVNFTDAPGDFLTYTVNVTGLSLTRSDGTVVNVLPATTTVDFAQYTDLSEFLTLAAMPVGTYTSGTVILDYSNADIEVQDNSGNALKVAPVDDNGNPITTLTLKVELDNTGRLVLVPGVPKLFQLDFNLAASNIVDLTDATVTVEPVLVASVNPNLSNQIAVRGPLSTVDTADNDFSLGLRPFYALSGDYGAMGIHVNSGTVYNINQVSYSGSAGLAALAAAGTDTAVVAKGTFDFSSGEFVAAEVNAGSSVPGGTLDAAEGVVLSRSGDDVVLRGSTLYRAGKTAIFADKVDVTLANSTKVHEEGSPKGSFDISDISVGQRLLVFGNLTSSNPASLALDASSGFAHMKYTRFAGNVVTAPSGGSMTVDVKYIEGRPIGMFDFTGTGNGTDADPTNYVVSLPGSLGGVSTINATDPVRVWGFVTPFGSAPPDFTATSVADYVNAWSILGVAWARPGTPGAFSSLSAGSGIVVNLATTTPPVLQDVEQGGIVNTLPSDPTIKGSLGIYAIAQDGKIQAHLDYASFVSDITSRLNAGAKVRGVFALGGYDSASVTLHAADAVVVMH